jgi:DNA polymerase-4
LKRSGNHSTKVESEAVILSMARCILHIDMDAFFASVEQRDRPELRGKPVVVGSPPDQRGVVCTCSYEARAFGIHSAMPSREAYRRCPHAVFLPPDMARYDEASRKVFEIFERFSPLIEPISCDEAFIDVTGAHTLFGSGEAIAKQLRALIHTEVHLAASVGVAHNKFLAKLGSERAKPDGLFVVPHTREGVFRFLGALKVGSLWGVGKVTGEALVNAGYQTVADIQKGDPKKLERLFGATFAEHLMSLAFGEDSRAVETENVEKSVSREYTFLTDCSDPELLRDVLRGLVVDVGERVRRHGFYAATGRLKLRWADFKTITRQAPFDVPVCDDFSFRALALKLFDTEQLIQPVRLIGFGVTGLTPNPREQLTLFDNARASRAKREKLCHTMDALRAKLGDSAISPGVIPSRERT